MMPLGMANVGDVNIIKQINGRDELEITVKARLDGEYAQKLSFLFDCKCFFGSIGKVLKHDGVVEGGTGTLHEERETVGK